MGIGTNGAYQMGRSTLKGLCMAMLNLGSYYYVYVTYCIICVLDGDDNDI